MNSIPYENFVPMMKLQIAAETGDLRTVQTVRNSGFNINSGNYDRNTVLHIASNLGQVEIVRYLLTIPGINVNAENRWGSTPLNYGKDHPVIGPLLRSAGCVMGRELPVNKMLAATYRQISNLKLDEYR